MNHGSCPVRGISVHLTEGNARSRTCSQVAAARRDRDRSFAATGNPGEVKIDVAVPTVAGETNSNNNHYTYHVAFQS